MGGVSCLADLLHEDGGEEAFLHCQPKYSQELWPEITIEYFHYDDLSQVIQNFHKLINPPISTQSRLVTFMFHQIAIYYHHHHHHNYQQQQQPLLLLKVRNLSLVYPAVTLCYKNEDQQGYKLNVLKVVVKTNDQTSFVVISLRNSISQAIGRMVQV